MRLKHQNSTGTIIVGLLWHSLSSDNLGVVALTESQMAIIHSAALRADVKVNFIIFGTTGSHTGLNILPNVTISDRLSIKRILIGKSRYIQQLNSCDIVLDIGEGDSFTDTYGLERFYYQIGTKALALTLGKLLVLSPQTIGPFERNWTEAIAGWLMKRARRVYARDELSQKYLIKLGVEKNAYESIDVAFRLPYTPLSFSKTKKVRVGINISGLLYYGGYSGKNQFDLTVDYPLMAETLLKYFTSRSDCEVHLVSHVLTELVNNEDDYAVSVEIASRYSEVIVAEKFNTPSAAKSYIASMDFFSGARMHACIAAFSAGVPVTPIAYSRKFTGLFSSLGYERVIDCKSLGTETAVARVVADFENRNQLRSEIRAGNILAQQKLQSYEDYLVTCLMDIND